MKCPKCESENTQRLEVAFHSGTQNTTATSNSGGLGFSGGRIGIAGGVFKTSAQTQSTLAIACSPPEKKPTKKLKLAIGFGGLLAVFGWGLGWIYPLCGVASVAFSLYRFRADSQFNSQEWPKLHQHWAESWICHKCGSFYHHA